MVLSQYANNVTTRGVRYRGFQRPKHHQQNASLHHAVHDADYYALDTLRIVERSPTNTRRPEVES
jgi:hypothetical protein